MIVKGKEHPHRYPPIIAQSLFEQVQQVIDGFNKKPYKYAGRPYMYRGLIRCADCGLAITPEMHKGFVYYYCTQYNGKHGGKWLREETITEQLGTVFKNLEVPEHIVAEINDILNKVHQSNLETHNREFEKITFEQKNF